MPSADFLSHFGLFVVKGFLDAGLCERLCAETRSAATLQADLVENGKTIFDRQVRRTKVAEVSSATCSLVTESLLSVKPQLEKYFNLELTSCQRPQFLVYEQGDFFVPHSDSDRAPGELEYVRLRSVSAVIFLNAETDSPERGSYCGGALTLYGLIDDPRARKYGFPLLGETGSMVAFRSDLLHEVAPVTHGRRCTIVTWFY